MDVQWAMWAIDIVNHDHGAFSIQEAYEWAFFDNFPVDSAHLTVILHCQFSAAEYGDTKHIEVRFIDIDANIVFSHPFTWEVPHMEPHHRFQWTFTLRFQGVHIEAPGEYEMAVIISGEPKYHLPLYVDYADEQEGYYENGGE